MSNHIKQLNRNQRQSSSMYSDDDDDSGMDFSRDEQPVVKKPSKLRNYAD